MKRCKMCGKLEKNCDPRCAGIVMRRMKVLSRIAKLVALSVLALAIVVYLISEYKKANTEPTPEKEEQALTDAERQRLRAWPDIPFVPVPLGNLPVPEVAFDPLPPGTPEELIERGGLELLLAAQGRLFAVVEAFDDPVVNDYFAMVTARPQRALITFGKEDYSQPGRPRAGYGLYSGAQANKTYPQLQTDLEYISLFGVNSWHVLTADTPAKIVGLGISNVHELAGHWQDAVKMASEEGPEKAYSLFGFADEDRRFRGQECVLYWYGELKGYRKGCEFGLRYREMLPVDYETCSRSGNAEAFAQQVFRVVTNKGDLSLMSKQVRGCAEILAREAGHPNPEAFRETPP